MPIDLDHLSRFKADLASLSLGEVYARYILSDACMGMIGVDERHLRDRIATRFSIDLKNIIIVGSAKVGFTLRHKPASENAEERPAFSPFSQNSDVDVAIVSDALFDNIWKRSFEFWHTSGYGRANSYWPRGKHFRDYIFRGWMRPDHLPSEGSFSYRSEWFDFFRQLTSDRAAGDYKVTGALYRERYFLEKCQHIAINECRLEVSSTP